VIELPTGAGGRLRPAPAGGSAPSGPASANYGAAAFAVKLVTSEFGSEPVQVFTRWPI